MKSRFATLELKAPMISTIIPQPKAQEREPNERAVDGRGVGEVHELRVLGVAGCQPAAGAVVTFTATAKAIESRNRRLTRKLRATGNHFQMWALKRTFFFSSKARQSRKRKGQSTSTPIPVVTMPLAENVP